MLPCLSGATLQAAAANTKGAFGIAGWLAAELALLPVSWWVALALVFARIEEGEDWPPELLQASVPLIPKGDGLGTLEQRPITVLCVQYR